MLAICCCALTLFFLMLCGVLRMRMLAVIWMKGIPEARIMREMMKLQMGSATYI